MFSLFVNRFSLFVCCGFRFSSIVFRSICYFPISYLFPLPHSLLPNPCSLILILVSFFVYRFSFYLLLSYFPLPISYLFPISSLPIPISLFSNFFFHFLCSQILGLCSLIFTPSSYFVSRRSLFALIPNSIFPPYLFPISLFPNFSFHFLRLLLFAPYSLFLDPIPATIHPVSLPCPDQS